MEVVAQGHGIVQRVDAGLGARRDGGVGHAVFVQQDGQGHGGLVAVLRGGCVVRGLQHAIPAAQQRWQDVGREIGGNGGVVPGTGHGVRQQPRQVFVQRLDQDVRGKLLQRLGVGGGGHGRP
ncbi:hypothetical protein D3C72_1413250 [compost metagenome]